MTQADGACDDGFSISGRSVYYHLGLLALLLPFLTLVTALSEENATWPWFEMLCVFVIVWMCFVLIYFAITSIVRDVTLAYLWTALAGFIVVIEGLMVQWVLALSSYNVHDAHIIALSLAVVLMVTGQVLIYYVPVLRLGVHDFIRIISYVSLIFFLYSGGAGLVEQDALGTSEVEVVGYDVPPKPDEVVDVELLPDIYYILPDMYASFALLGNEYQFDNNEFSTALLQRGFHIDKDSHSHYTQTRLSMAALLMMDYLSPEYSYAQIESIYQHNPVLDLLKRHGYHIYQTGTHITDIGGYSLLGKEQASHFEVNDFRSFLRFTLRESLVRSVAYLLYGEENWFNLHHQIRLTALASFDAMHHIARQKTNHPKLVYSYLYPPHNPFVFDARGQARAHYELYNNTCCPKRGAHQIDGHNYEWSIDRRAYLEQMRYVNHRLIAVIDDIKKHATRPYVIVLQGDHGPQSVLDWNNPSDLGINERMSVLAAIYHSNDSRASHSDSISHVNLFREILNQYFGYNYTSLPYRGYFSDYKFPMEFRDVTSIVSPSSTSLK